MSDNNVFKKWNKDAGKELADAVKEAEKNTSGEYKEIPLGDYEVAVTKAELKESKAGDPMVSIWFKVLAGEFKNSIIFFNQVVTRDFQLAIANRFLRSLETGVEVEFNGDFEQYADMIADVYEKSDGFEYLLAYGKNKNGYNTYSIETVFEVE